MLHDHFRQALEDGDVSLLRKMWAHAAPRMPQPLTEAEAAGIMHYARTVSEVVTFRSRAYSHAWLLERSLPSGLPDRLRPRAQRLYPVTVSAVGLAVGGKSEISRAVGPYILDAMETAVLELEADGQLLNTPLVRQRVQEARTTEMRRLIGKLR